MSDLTGEDGHTHAFTDAGICVRCEEPDPRGKPVTGEARVVDGVLYAMPEAIKYYGKPFLADLFDIDPDQIRDHVGEEE